VGVFRMRYVGLQMLYHMALLKPYFLSSERVEVEHTVCSNRSHTLIIELLEAG